MKKGKVFGKSQIVLGVLIVALGLAVFLNMKFSAKSIQSAGNDSDSLKNLGEAIYVSNDEENEDAVATSAGNSYISSARIERNTARESSVSELKTIVQGASGDETAKNKALEDITAIAGRVDAESAIETIIKSKGFSDALAIVASDSVTVIVPCSETLLTSETLQIQDAVKSQVSIDLEKIKIITVK